MLWNLQDSYKLRKGANKSSARLTKDYNTDRQAKLNGYQVKLPSLRQFLSTPSSRTPQSLANNPTTLPKYDAVPSKQDRKPAPEATHTLPTPEPQVYNAASPTLYPTAREPPRSITRDHEPKANNYSEEQLLRQIELLPQTDPNLFRQKSMFGQKPNVHNRGMPPPPPPPLHIAPQRETTPPTATPLFLAYQNLKK